MSAAPADRLRALREETEVQIRGLDRRIDAITAARADANSDDEHDPEGATIGFERAQDDALRTAMRRRLAEIDAAFARVAAGTYGSCAVCGDPIPPGRLDARPTADRCLRHALSVVEACLGRRPRNVSSTNSTPVPRQGVQATPTASAAR